VKLSRKSFNGPGFAAHCTRSPTCRGEEEGFCGCAKQRSLVRLRTTEAYKGGTRWSLEEIVACMSVAPKGGFAFGLTCCFLGGYLDLGL